jgi:hypothetical protein
MAQIRSQTKRAITAEERASQGISPPFARTQRSFSSTCHAAKTLAKERATALSTEDRAVDEVLSQLATFRVK